MTIFPSNFMEKKFIFILTFALATPFLGARDLPRGTDPRLGNPVLLVHHVHGGLHLENKGIVFKARWFVRPDINTGATII